MSQAADSKWIRSFFVRETEEKLPVSKKNRTQRAKEGIGALRRLEPFYRFQVKFCARIRRLKSRPGLRYETFYRHPACSGASLFSILHAMASGNMFHGAGMKRNEAGDAISIFCLIGLSLPSLRMANSTTVLETPFPASRYFPVGSMTKLRTSLPPVG